MSAALLCHEMGWTYQEYLEQPVRFIAILHSMLNQKARAQDLHNKTNT